MAGPGNTSELQALLMTRSLSDPELMRVSGEAPDYAILPDVSVLKIGGQSLIDRGAAAVHPLVEELVEVKESHQILIGTGGGTRARHVYALAADLGMPTGVLTDVGAAVAGQNAQMLGYLMARHGVPVVGGSGFGAIALYLAECGAAIFAGMPPYDMWQHVPSEGVIPPYRTDAGCYLVAEVYGCAEHGLRQGRGRPLHGQPEDRSGREAHPERHRRRARARWTCRTSSSSARCSTSCATRAT